MGAIYWIRFNYATVSTILHIDMVTTEIKVENTTMVVANSLSPLYCTAKMLVVAPAGMAASNTLTPVIKESIPSSLHAP